MPKKPLPTDVLVGRRIRLRRKQLGMSQTGLGEQLGVAFQQIRKYEKGTNRVGASRSLSHGGIVTGPWHTFLVWHLGIGLGKSLFFPWPTYSAPWARYFGE